jgi:1-acyl-sn-glycerol-3-phosphate acyltransferase
MMTRQLDRSVSAPPSQLSPWLAPMAYAFGGKGLLPRFFGEIEVIGQQHIPQTGPVLLAPTHRSRWDSLLVAHTARLTSDRYLRFMVTADECCGVQGWLIKRLGGFPVDVRQPAIASLRYGVELLQQQQMLVIFPEGDIFRDQQVHPLKPGLARLALKAEQTAPNPLGVKIVPISLRYDQPYPTWGSRVQIRVGPSLSVAQYRKGQPLKQQAQQLTADLQTALTSL